jgi:hypothetical protein
MFYLGDDRPSYNPVHPATLWWPQAWYDHPRKEHRYSNITFMIIFVNNVIFRTLKKIKLTKTSNDKLHDDLQLLIMSRFFPINFEARDELKEKKKTIVKR